MNCSYQTKFFFHPLARRVENKLFGIRFQIHQQFFCYFSKALQIKTKYSTDRNIPYIAKLITSNNFNLYSWNISMHAKEEAQYFSGDLQFTIGTYMYLLSIQGAPVRKTQSNIFSRGKTRINLCLNKKFQVNERKWYWYMSTSFQGLLEVKSSLCQFSRIGNIYFVSFN